MTRRFADGTVVRVRALFPPGHCRTPFYTRGRRGTVLRLIDRQPNPEMMAYGWEGQTLPVYRVRFEADELWGGPVSIPGDAVVADLFEPWLEPIEGGKP
ncbi:MAG: SH3-like domain-containing protein [Geminicoccaceae bacterium]